MKNVNIVENSYDFLSPISSVGGDREVQKFDHRCF